MRISDWSSDVCSSDLGIYRRRLTLASGRFAMMEDGLGFQLVPWRPALDPQLGKHISGTMAPGGGVDWSFGKQRGRSEEHTSELQSLMRNSYAVFCLKKKTHSQNIDHMTNLHKYNSRM